MRPGWARSIRARLLLGAGLVLLAFLAAAGLAVQSAHADSVRAAHFGRLQGTVYLLLARAELDPDGSLVMPDEFEEPRLSLPGSGLYARIDLQRQQAWQSRSALSYPVPVLAPQPPGQWHSQMLASAGRRYLAVGYGVQWVVGDRRLPLAITVMEDASALEREMAVFARTLWAWLAAAGALLLAAQIGLLHWGLAPLRRIARQIAEVEAGRQGRVEGRFPQEIAGLADNLNTLIAQERNRQQRYREALSFLAHSLKTPLAVLRGALAEPTRLAATVDEQVGRMDAIVHHQLTRAGAGGATRFAAPVAVAPVLARTRDALVKVHAGRGLALAVDCPADLHWRIDEGDLFEIVGNLMDNAAKWARLQVRARAWLDGDTLCLTVEDDGPGFSDTESILQLHVRLDERVPGHGVGLAVVSDLVASHHGTLVLGAASGGGARVEVRLPRP